jgi:hypothetical protein
MKSFEEMYNELKSEFDQYKKESVKWSVNDFLWYDGYKISEENAQIALEEMISKHDAEDGISWSTVEHYLDKYGERIEEDQE